MDAAFHARIAATIDTSTRPRLVHNQVWSIAEEIFRK